MVIVNGPLGSSNGVSGVNGRVDPFFLSLSTPFLATPADNKTYARYYISLQPDFGFNFFKPIIYLKSNKIDSLENWSSHVKFSTYNETSISYNETSITYNQTSPP